MITCTNFECGWSGESDELVCSDEDENKPVAECKFNRCPDCGGTDFDEEDEEEDEEEDAPA